jgi:hypothetical protein
MWTAALFFGMLPAVGLNGHAVDPFAVKDDKAIVMIFLRTDCPISNRYAPELQRIGAKFSPRHVRFWLVFPDKSEPPEKVRQHVAEYHFPGKPLLDPNKELVRAAEASVTPEAAVFLPDRKLVYHGRIDDRVADFGKVRPRAATHDLEDALESVLAGKPVAQSSTKAIGCYISDLP